MNENLNFGQALEAIKEGMRAAHVGVSAESLMLYAEQKHEKNTKREWGQKLLPLYEDMLLLNQRGSRL